MENVFQVTEFGVNSTIDKLNATLLENSWSWPIGGENSMADFYESILRDNYNESLYFWLYEKGKLAGLFGFTVYDKKQNIWETVSFLEENFRGKGLNQMMMLFSVYSFQELCIPLVASVNMLNVASQQSLDKLIPEWLAEESKIATFESRRDETGLSKADNAYLYNLSAIKLGSFKPLLNPTVVYEAIKVRLKL